MFGVETKGNDELVSHVNHVNETIYLANECTINGQNITELEILESTNVREISGNKELKSIKIPQTI